MLPMKSACKKNGHLEKCPGRNIAMQTKNVILFLALILTISICGCSSLGIQTPFGNDPLTGGQDATTSLLLGVPIPAGMQRYPSHGYTSTGVDGQTQGLETYRGNVDSNYAATTMFNGLQSAGWHLRMQNRKGDRAVYVYQKGKSLADIVFHRQGILTIMEIWESARLEDGMSLLRPDEENSTPSLAGEEYGPLDEPKPRGQSESWGNKNLEEKDI